LEAAADEERFGREALDLSLPGRLPPRGTHHLITETMAEIVDIFVSLGYTMTWGPEVETAWHNFDALNMPEDHPARLQWDTFYVDWGDGEEDTVLRTHTSPMQARYMLEHPPPVYVLGPGRVFRRDTFDATHSPVFHQVEGLAVDEGITFADLRGTLAYFARQFFGPGRRLRLLPSHFRFTEPSAEGHVSCFACDGSGCRICGHTGWIELFGCGMVHPHVFESVGYDPAQVTGFAFGMGADRAAMIRHGLTDLRYFWEGDLRVLEQFR
jgi:phenylalanyl-tRNA synthetase alpha chain